MNTPIQTRRGSVFATAEKLRITFVTETYPPDINGVAHTTSKVVEGLLAKGHELTLVRPRQHNNETPARRGRFQELLVRGIPIPMYQQLRMGFPAGGELRRLWRAARPDIVHIATEGPLGWSALRAARSLQIPVSTDFRTNFHAYSRFYGIGWLKGAIESYMRKFHNDADCTMVPTQQLKRELAGMAFDRLSVVPRGVDTKIFSPYQNSAELRKSWGAAPDTVVILSVGRLAAEKNLAAVVRCYNSLRGAQVRVKLVIVGDGPLRRQLQIDCPDAVFAGFQTGRSLAEHYASADMFIFPSLTETFGNVTLEAMASGLAVVAYDHAAAHELIRNQKNGLAVSPGREDLLLAGALQVAGDITLRNSMRLRARQAALAQGWDAIVERTEAVFRAAILRTGETHEVQETGLYQSPAP